MKFVAPRGNLALGIERVSDLRYPDTFADAWEVDLPYIMPRVSLELYEQELASLLRIVTMDLKGDDDLAQAIVFSPTQTKERVSPAELLRKGMVKDAYEAARDNFLLVKNEMPNLLVKSPRMHHKVAKSKSR
jgi:hypothetical protein